MAISRLERNRRQRKYNEKLKQKSKEKFRNEDGFTQREEIKISRMVIILCSLEQGMTQKEIAEKFSLSQPIVNRMIKEYKENLLDRKVKKEINERFKELKKELEKIEKSQRKLFI